MTTRTETTNGPALDHARLDRDARRETAYNTFVELVVACRGDLTGHPWVPTLRGLTAGQRRLRSALLSLGLRVWPSEAEVRR